MIQKTVQINTPSGLHARPAAVFVRTAAEQKATIHVIYESKEVDAKSILGILSLGAAKGASVTLRADGEDAEKALSRLSAILESHEEVF